MSRGENGISHAGWEKYKPEPVTHEHKCQDHQQKAEQAVDTVLDFFKNNPQQLASLVEKFGGGGVAGKIGGLFS